MISLPTSPSGGHSLAFAAWKGSEITDALMENCATLFSNNYGIWGPQVLDHFTSFIIGHFTITNFVHAVRVWNQKKKIPTLSMFFICVAYQI